VVVLRSAVPHIHHECIIMKNYELFQHLILRGKGKEGILLLHTITSSTRTGTGTGTNLGACTANDVSLHQMLIRGNPANWIFENS
jgi:hypothetical protein